MPTREELENMKSYEPTDDVKKLVKEKVEEIRRLKGMLLAKRFTELTGLELPENYNAADILNVMWERKDCYGFIANIVKAIKYKIPLNVLAYFINDYILNPTALLREAVEFLEQLKGE